LNKIKKELFETFEDLKDVTVNGETFKSRGKMVFLTSNNKELEKAVQILLPYEIDQLREWLLQFTEEKPELRQCLIYIN
jgi:hypothetical protein